MELKFIPTKAEQFYKIGLFAAVIAIIVLLFPSNNKFNFQFEVGKPWSYELITASFDFPIYKNEVEIAKEQHQILKDFTPYFQLDTTVAELAFKKLVTDSRAKDQIPLQSLQYIHQKLQEIYRKGILSVDDYNKLLEDKQSNLTIILPNRMTNNAKLKSLYTPKTAYEAIVQNAPENISSCNLNVYLNENLSYDKKTSELSKAELLKNVSLSSGMVQSGERIIDRGEIITPETYLVLQSLKIEFEKRNSSIQQSSTVIVGETIMILCLIGLYFTYIYLFRPRIYSKFGNLVFMSLLIILMVAMTSLTLQYTSFNYYIVPFALLPIIVRVFFDPRTALFAHIITMLIIALFVDDSFQFLVLQITVGMAAVSSLKDMTQRSQLAQSAFYIFISYLVIYFAFELISEGDVHRIHWQAITYFAISSAFLLLAYVLIYLFEKIFGLISAITLVELTNINSELMIKFAEIAPGTFQHSLQVSGLATEAAKKINANSLLVRTGALYHDIGKMNNPSYFIENQMGGVNPLSSIDFEKAAKIVISHVSDGIEIAKANRLPEQIINFIGTHHGTSKTKYFYNSFINANPGIEPDERLFTYPGPLPNNKETAILMMADAVEARSRSIAEYTNESINEMVESMIDGQIADGQFKNAPISFRDVETVKAVFKTKIKSMYHTRMEYPELEKR